MQVTSTVNKLQALSANTLGHESESGSVKRVKRASESPAQSVLSSDEMQRWLATARFYVKAERIRNSDSTAFTSGYDSDLSLVIPGYSPSMSQSELEQLGANTDLTPKQFGALQRKIDRRLIATSMDYVKRFSQAMPQEGAQFRPISQGYYATLVADLSSGKCAGLSYAMAAAIAQGKQHIFMDNMYRAMANPSAPEAQAFINTIAELHADVEVAGVYFDPAHTRMASYSTVVPELASAKTSKTLLMQSEAHAFLVSVSVHSDNNRTYHYYDPNAGHVEFSSKEAFEKGLKIIFTSTKLSDFHTRLEGTRKDPHFRIGEFKPGRSSFIVDNLGRFQALFQRPLSAKDTAHELIESRLLPSTEDLRKQVSTPVGLEAAKLAKVFDGLDDVHSAHGIKQFARACETRESIIDYLSGNSDSPAAPTLRELERKLTRVISEAAAPVGYPLVFEQMESRRAGLSQKRLDPDTDIDVVRVEGRRLVLSVHGQVDEKNVSQVVDGLGAAFAKIKASPSGLTGFEDGPIRVDIAKPGAQAETQLFLGKPPVLVVGDDFFATPAASEASVADRVAHQARDSGGDSTAARQAAFMVGKLAGLYQYNVNPDSYMALINSKQSVNEVGAKLGTLASRSPKDFVDEAFTARIYDGALDSDVDSLRTTLLQPKPVAAATVSTPARPSVANSVAATVDNQTVERLRQLDATQPPLRVGEAEISRVDLYKMGARVQGKPIENALANDPDGKRLAGKLQIDYGCFEAYVKGTTPEVGERVTEIVAEIAIQRGPGAPPLMRDDGVKRLPTSLEAQLGDLPMHHEAIKALSKNKISVPGNFFSAPVAGQSSGATTSGGLGFQAFSTFQGLRSSIEALQRGDTTLGGIGLGAVTSDYVGMGIEIGMNKLAQKAVVNAAPTVIGFRSSSIGKIIGKAGEGVGVVISIPFDAYNAVDSFKKAGSSTGKEAQDHYVNGAFAVTNAATSIALGAAFMANASNTGPVGLAIAGVLMASQAIYSAVRTVEDIDTHTPLTGGQKFNVGLKSFLGFEPGFSVIKPYLEAKYAKEYVTQNKARYEEFLQGEGKEHFERVVFGSADVEVTKVPGKVPLTPRLWWNIPSLLLNLINVPGQVTQARVTGGSDHIASPYKSWNDKPVNAVEGEQGATKATLWDLGDGDDWVTGIENKPNFFLLGGGKKGINGGEADDTVVFNADARQVLEQAQQVLATENAGFSPRQTSLEGGGGHNTLTFSGPLSTTYTEGGAQKTAQYLGHVINLKTNTVSIKTENSNTHGVKKIAHVQSFSNVVTVEKGESVVQGNDENNLFTLNGDNDVLYTGKGTNVIVVNGGADVFGEGGSNTYIINKNHMGVTITDPSPSVVKLDYSAAQVSGWNVSSSGDLSVNLIGETDQHLQKIVIKNAFSDDSNGDKALVTFITNDGVMMTINAPRQAGSSSRVVQVSSLKVEAPKA